MALTEWEARQIETDCYTEGEELTMENDPTQTYRCQGCGGTSDSRETMESHEAGCVLALRAAVEILTLRLTVLVTRVDTLETEKRERQEAEERQAEWQEQLDGYRQRRADHRAYLSKLEKDALDCRIEELERRTR